MKLRVPVALGGIILTAAALTLWRAARARLGRSRSVGPGRRRRGAAGRRRPRRARAPGARGRASSPPRDGRLNGYHTASTPACCRPSSRAPWDTAATSPRSSSRTVTALGLRLEDGRIEQTSGGREFGAAVRLLSGEHTYYALSDAVDEAGARWRPRTRWRPPCAPATARPALAELGPACTRPAAIRSRCRPSRWPSAARPACCVPATRRRAPPATRSVQVIVGYADTRQRVLIANSLGDLVRDDRTRTRFTSRSRRPARRASSRPATRRSAAAPASSSSTRRRRGASPRRPPARRVTMLDSRPAPDGRHAGRARQRLRRHALPRGLRPRPRGGRHRQGREHLRRQAGRGGGGAHRQRLDDGSLANGWGSQAFDDEGVPTQQDDGHRGRPPHRLPVRPPARPRGRRRAHRQRPAPVVPPRAHTAHDHHLHRPRRRRRRRHHRRDRAWLLRQEPGRRAGGAGQRQLRVRRCRGLPHRERPHHRRRCAAPRWWATASTSS